MLHYYPKWDYIKAAMGGSIYRGAKKNDQWNATPEIIEIVKRARGFGKTFNEIAALLGISRETLRSHKKKNDALRLALDHGQLESKFQAESVLYELAVKKKDFRALEFLLKSRYGYRTTERLEHSGPDGRAIDIKTINEEQLDERIRYLTSKLKVDLPSKD